MGTFKTKQMLPKAFCWKYPNASFHLDKYM